MSLVPFSFALKSTVEITKGAQSTYTLNWMTVFFQTFSSIMANWNGCKENVWRAFPECLEWMNILRPAHLQETKSLKRVPGTRAWLLRQSTQPAHNIATLTTGKEAKNKQQEINEFIRSAVHDTLVLNKRLGYSWTRPAKKYKWILSAREVTMLKRPSLRDQGYLDSKLSLDRPSQERERPRKARKPCHRI